MSMIFGEQDKKMPTQPRKFRPALQLVVSLAVLTASLSATSLAAVAINISPDLGVHWLRPSSFLLLAALGGLSAASCVVAWWSLVLIRQKKIEELDPTSLVFSSRMTEELKKVTSDSSLRMLHGRMTSGFTVAANDEGIVVWCGPLRSPSSTIQIRWRDVSSVSAGVVHDLTRNSNGILITFCPDRSLTEITLAFAAIGSGPAKIFQLSQKRTASLAEEINSRLLANQAKSGKMQ